MNIKNYLDAKYGPGATTMLYVEAKAFGVTWPLAYGWLREHGGTEITSDTAERLKAALERKGGDSAEKGLTVLRDAWLTLSRKPGTLSQEFFTSKAWKRARYQALRRSKGVCEACGASPATGAVLNVDHVLPRRLYPALALVVSNLQVLCGDCNEGKGNWDMTDWRDEKTKVGA